LLVHLVRVAGGLMRDGVTTGDQLPVRMYSVHYLWS